MTLVLELRREDEISDTPWQICDVNTAKQA